MSFSFWAWSANASMPGLSLGANYAPVFKYKEPGVMTEEGSLAGIYGSYLSLRSEGLSFRIQGQYLAGELDYTGGTYDTETGETTASTTTTEDSVLQAQSDFGVGFAIGGGHFLRLYGGLAYRLWKDEIKSSAGYRRHTSYLYLPLGAELFMETSRAYFSFELQYNHWIQGHNKSYLSDANPNFGDYEFDQEEGTGYQLALQANLKLSSLLPFVRFEYQAWKVEDSELQYFPSTGGYLLEPKNETQVFSIQVGLSF